nr:zinc finger, CCHC-type [Tanacetum cinerariifolium]
MCRGLILNSKSDTLFDIYQFHGSAKELCDSLEAIYMVEDSSSKKFLVSNFNNYKMVDSRLVMEKYNEILDKHASPVPETNTITGSSSTISEYGSPVAVSQNSTPTSYGWPTIMVPLHTWLQLTKGSKGKRLFFLFSKGTKKHGNEGVLTCGQNISQ